MANDDIVFVAYNKARDITYTLYEGSELTYGKKHIIHRRAYMENKMDAIKKAAEETNFAYWDEDHQDYGNRERLYCLGADDKRPDMYMKVIAEYKSDFEAKIITAWETKEVAPDERTITYFNK